MKDLTLLIPTYNRSLQIIRALESVVQQDYPVQKWECIVVNNNSKDDTQERVAEFITAHPECDLKLHFEQTQGRSAALNSGIAIAGGDIIAMIDDDETIPVDFVGDYVKLFTGYPDINVAGGRYIPTYPSGRPRWMSHYLERPIAYPLDLGRKVRLFPAKVSPGGGNLAVRKFIFDKYGGFATHLGRSGGSLVGGEDFEFAQRMRDAAEPILYTPKSVMYHHIEDDKLTKEYVDKLTYNIGVGQRMRSQKPLVVQLAAEGAKWGVFFIVALFFVLTLRPAKSAWLLRMRYNVTRGLLAKEKK